MFRITKQLTGGSAAAAVGALCITLSLSGCFFDFSSLWQAPAPQDFTAFASTSSSVQLTWKDTTNEDTSYAITRSQRGSSVRETVSQKSYIIQISSGSSYHVYSDSDTLDPGTTYTYYLTAEKTSIFGDTSLSSEVSSTVSLPFDDESSIPRPSNVQAAKGSPVTQSGPSSSVPHVYIAWDTPLGESEENIRYSVYWKEITGDGYFVLEQLINGCSYTGPAYPSSASLLYSSQSISYKIKAFKISESGGQMTDIPESGFSPAAAVDLY